MVSFGGAGPLHAAELAKKAGISDIVVPTHPGVASATGLVMADGRVDYEQTMAMRSDQYDRDQIEDLLGSLTRKSVEDLQHEGFEGETDVSMAMGWGGRPYGDGNDSVIVVNGNCRNTPVEVFETRYPWVTEKYELRQDSGGPGDYRGGLGIERILETRAPQITVSALFDRMKNAPRGLKGGEEGGKSSITVEREGDNEFRTFVEAFGTDSPSKFADVKVTESDRVRIRSPGGGGYGDSEDRSEAMVWEDVKEGFVSPDAAREHYGIDIDTDAGLDVTTDGGETSDNS